MFNYDRVVARAQCLTGLRKSAGYGKNIAVGSGIGAAAGMGAAGIYHLLSWNSRNLLKNLLTGFVGGAALGAGTAAAVTYGPEKAKEEKRQARQEKKQRDEKANAYRQMQAKRKEDDEAQDRQKAQNVMYEAQKKRRAQEKENAKPLFPGPPSDEQLRKWKAEGVYRNYEQQLDAAVRATGRTDSPEVQKAIDNLRKVNDWRIGQAKGK